MAEEYAASLVPKNWSSWDSYGKYTSININKRKREFKR